MFSNFEKIVSINFETFAQLLYGDFYICKLSIFITFLASDLIQRIPDFLIWFIESLQ